VSVIDVAVSHREVCFRRELRPPNGAGEGKQGQRRWVTRQGSADYETLLARSNHPGVNARVYVCGVELRR
jgi:hypothetical protein